MPFLCFCVSSGPSTRISRIDRRMSQKLHCNDQFLFTLTWPSWICDSTSFFLLWPLWPSLYPWPSWLSRTYQLWLQAILLAFCDQDRAPLLQCPWVVILYLCQKCTRKERSFKKIFFSNGIDSILTLHHFRAKKAILLQLAENKILFDFLKTLSLDPLPDEQSQLSKGIL